MLLHIVVLCYSVQCVKKGDLRTIQLAITTPVHIKHTFKTSKIIYVKHAYDLLKCSHIWPSSVNRYILFSFLMLNVHELHWTFLGSECEFWYQANEIPPMFAVLAVRCHLSCDMGTSNHCQNKAEGLKAKMPTDKVVLNHSQKCAKGLIGLIKWRCVTFHLDCPKRAGVVSRYLSKGPHVKPKCKVILCTHSLWKKYFINTLDIKYI